jgi:hypothetical protein
MYDKYFKGSVYVYTYNTHRKGQGQFVATRFVPGYEVSYPGV